jgi:glycerol-3-phosphate acyltransferase PlsY
MKLTLVLVLGYLIGSIPFALVIGKGFYKTDVRQFGSGNLGGGNTGRVLGKRAGLSTMALDLLKVTFVMLIAKLLGGNDTMMALGALAAGIGHCFPIFAVFKGGKAVAAMYGYLFGLFAVAGRSPVYFFLPLVVFMIVIVLSRIISLSSMISAVVITFYICIRPEPIAVKIVQIIFAVLIIVRHRSNIVRIINHNENTVSWVPRMKK